MGLLQFSHSAFSGSEKYNVGFPCSNILQLSTCASTYEAKLNYVQAQTSDKEVEKYDSTSQTQVNKPIVVGELK